MEIIDWANKNTGGVTLLIFILGVIGTIFYKIIKIFYDARSKIWYLLCKLKLNLFPVDFNIAFSIEFTDGLNSGKYFTEIKKILKKQLKR